MWKRLSDRGRQVVSLLRWASDRMDSVWNSAFTAALLCLAGAYAAYWAYHTIPLPGISIGLLAAAAAVMTLRPQPMSFLEKVCWGVIVSTLLVAETRSIHQDRTNADAQAKADRKTQDKAFAEVLTAQKDDFRNIASGLKRTYKLSEKQFSKTISTMTNSHREDENNFAGVLTREDTAFQEEHSLSEQLRGRLVPGTDPVPPNACTTEVSQIEEGYVMVIVGSNTDMTKQFPHTILKVGDFPVISVDRIPGTKDLSLSIDLRDKQNKILFRMDKNGVVNRSGLILLRPNKSTFLFQDEYGKEIFKARYLNPKVFQIDGTVVYCGQTVPLKIPISGMCSVDNGSAISLSAPSCSAPGH